MYDSSNFAFVYIFEHKFSYCVTGEFKTQMYQRLTYYLGDKQEFDVLNEGPSSGIGRISLNFCLSFR